MREERKEGDNLYTLTFEAVIDNSEAGVEITVKIKNDGGEEASANLIFDQDPYAKR